MEINSADPGGCAGEAVLERYRQLARGRWGMVFTEAVAVDGNALARRNGLVLCRKTLESFRRLVSSFREINHATPLIIQLNHPGRNNCDITRRIKIVPDDLDDIPVATAAWIDSLREKFLDAAALAREAGADGVDIKACHGYLGAEFLRPSNRRNDGYGGGREGRARFLSSIIAGLKSQFPDMIVGSRISIFEGIRGGCGTPSGDELVEDLDDMMGILRLLAAAGADFFNVSAGIPVMTPMLTRPEAKSSLLMLDHFRYSRTVKREFPGIAVIGSAYSAGTKDSIALAEENIGRGYADFAGFGRQNLADPLFPRKAMDSPESIDRCTLCGGCSKLLKEQQPVRCTVYPPKEYD
jgi:2,4-dienoyl-CoA reductase-like NADH-dependent reductase (Old Yellow Enzyme family)